MLCAGNGDRIPVFLLIEILINNQSLVRGIPLISLLLNCPKIKVGALLAGNYGHVSDMIFYLCRLGCLHILYINCSTCQGKVVTQR